jgi:hypothetical protein
MCWLVRGSWGASFGKCVEADRTGGMAWSGYSLRASVMRGLKSVSEEGRPNRLSDSGVLYRPQWDSVGHGCFPLLAAIPWAGGGPANVSRQCTRP